MEVNKKEKKIKTIKKTKKTITKKKENRGRPKAIKDEDLKKLEQAFSIGCTSREAIVHSGVKASTFYDYVRDHPEFSDRIELLKEKTPLKARMVVENALNKGDVNTAKWYLERKKRDEFSTQQLVDLTSQGEKIGIVINKIYESK